MGAAAVQRCAEPRAGAVQKGAGRRAERRAERRCTPVHTDYPQFFHFSEEAGERALKKEAAVRWVLPISAAAVSFGALQSVPVTVGAATAGVLFSNAGDLFAGKGVSRKARILSAFAVAFVTVGGKLATVNQTIPEIFGGSFCAVGLIFSVIAYSGNRKWRNLEINAQGDATNETINSVFYHGEHAASTAWTNGGHARAQYACRQGLRDEEGVELLVHERIISTVGRTCYEQGHNDRSAEVDESLKKVTDERDEEFKRRDDLIRQVIDLMEPVFGLEKIPSDNYEEAAALAQKARSYIDNMEEGDEGSSLREMLYERNKEVHSLQTRLDAKCAQYRALLDKYEEDVENNAPTTTGNTTPASPEVTPQDIMEAYDAGGVSWSQLADRFGMKRSTVRLWYQKAKEAAENG